MATHIEQAISNTRTRTLMILAGVMLLIGIIVAIYSFTASNDILADAPSSTAELPGGIAVTPGVTGSEKYKELQEEANVRGTKKAASEGSTFIPTIVSTPVEGNNKDFSEIANTLQSQDATSPKRRIASLLAQLAERDKQIENLLKLLEELRSLGYNIDNLNQLLNKLNADGYNTDKLQQLLNKLQSDGLSVDDLKKLLQQLQSQYPELVNDLLAKLFKDDLAKFQELLAALRQAGLNPNNSADLLAKLATLGVSAKDLQKLLDALQAKGFSIKDLEELLKQLQQNNHPTSQLEDLLKKALGEFKAREQALAAALQRLADRGLSDINELLQKLKAQGADINELQNLLNELKNKGFDADKLANLLAQLAAKGYDVNDLKKLLSQLQADGLQVTPMLDLAKQHKLQYLADLFDAGIYPKVHREQLTDKLTQVFNPTDPNKANELTGLLGEQLDPEYAAILKQQQEQDLAEQQRLEQERLALEQQQQAFLEQQSIAQTLQEKQQAIADAVSVMTPQADFALSAWTQIPEQTFVAGEPAKQATANNANPPLPNIQDDLYLADDQSVFKAGTILFAVLETGVNSDEPSPILAKIVQPPLKNARLIGTMQLPRNQYVEKLTLNFSTINIPGHDNSYPISAVAIDPDTARTALASNVDHHYLLRWGSLFASSFLQGYSKAVAESGTTVQIDSNGPQTTTSTTKDKLSGRQQIFEGLGVVGDRWGQAVGDSFNRPITITIKSGISVGILLTSDLTVEDTGRNKKLQTTLKPATPIAQQAAPVAAPLQQVANIKNSSEVPNNEK